MDLIKDFLYYYCNKYYFGIINGCFFYLKLKFEEKDRKDGSI